MEDKELYEICKKCDGQGKRENGVLCLKCFGKGEVVWTKNIFKSSAEEALKNVLLDLEKTIK